jgi:hypothetical protein
MRRTGSDTKQDPRVDQPEEREPALLSRGHQAEREGLTMGYDIAIGFAERDMTADELVRTKGLQFAEADSL